MGIRLLGLAFQPIAPLATDSTATVNELAKTGFGHPFRSAFSERSNEHVGFEAVSVNRKNGL
jgi:hypothetical protein